jgi:uncharacterized membrane protein YgcG
MLRRAIFALILFTAALWWTPAARADANDFQFDSFSADYYLSRDSHGISHLHAVEQLVAVFPESDQNHGILRAIPQVYEGHDVNLQIESVTNETGHNLTFSKETSNHNLVLRIGDADQYVHGRQSYTITYNLDNVTAKPQGFDGFFWDVNGTEWSQSFATVTAHVHLPTDLQAAYLPAHNRCFTGAAGSTAQHCTIITAKNGAEAIITNEADHPLAAGETLTFELGFKPDTFVAYTMPPGQMLKLIALWLGLGVLPVGLALWLVLPRWWRYGRDPKGRGTIIPEYLPPKDLSVISTSAILKQGFQPKAISAAIIDLAVRHYLRVYEVAVPRRFAKDTTAYEVELIYRDDKLRSEETAVLDLLFGPGAAIGSRVKLDDLKNKLYKEAKTIGSTVDEQLTATGYFRNNPEKAGTTLYVIGLVLGVSGFFFLPYSLGVLIAAGICIIGGFIMPARTQQGVDTRDYLLGLKMYMKLAEADRIKALQAPHGKLTEKIDTTDKKQLVKLYEKLLPYAVLFGIEQDWAKQFADLYEEAPSWYSGSANFNAIYFAGAMHGFGETSTASFTSPSSSSSGGSAGGGGGGGGGGGW